MRCRTQPYVNKFINSLRVPPRGKRDYFFEASRGGVRTWSCTLSWIVLLSIPSVYASLAPRVCPFQNQERSFHCWVYDASIVHSARTEILCGPPHATRHALECLSLPRQSQTQYLPALITDRAQKLQASNSEQSSRIHVFRQFRDKLWGALQQERVLSWWDYRHNAWLRQ